MKFLGALAPVPALRKQRLCFGFPITAITAIPAISCLAAIFLPITSIVQAPISS
jgi:hypothetical protein